MKRTDEPQNVRKRLIGFTGWKPIDALMFSEPSGFCELHAAEENVSSLLMFVQMKTDLRRRLLKAHIQVVSTGSLSEDACGGVKRLKVCRTFHLKS